MWSSRRVQALRGAAQRARSGAARPFA